LALIVTPGRLIRERRLAHGLTQSQLALRAGSTQAAVSRLERDEISPTYDNLTRLLAVMGEEPRIAAHRQDSGFDRARLRSLRERPAEERLLLAISWNRLAGQVAAAGDRARHARSERSGA
jgi:transcriptional regulator with XRE-family HTH domain